VVCVQGEKSESCEVDSGVPQGTVLGPVLFSVFIDDLEVEIKRRNLDVLIFKFTDDTKGAKVIESVMDKEKMQEALTAFAIGQISGARPSILLNVKSCTWEEATQSMNTNERSQTGHHRRGERYRCDNYTELETACSV
jgi:hypothetical protein